MIKDRTFTKVQIDNALSNAIGKTLLELDSKGIFQSLGDIRKCTGIAGDIIECSVLGCTRDSKQEPDLDIEGNLTELKTTGVRKPKKNDSPYIYECKEPVSITAVSIDKIVNEVFETSNFWHKLAHLLWVYYFYNSKTTATLKDYKNFPVVGYQFYQFSDIDKERLRNDWLHVQEFLLIIHRDYPTEEAREKQYPRLSSELRGVLLLIDTAPKYPNRPRFRLKRAFATTIADSYFQKQALQTLAQPVTQYSQIDEKCKLLTVQYKGWSIGALKRRFGLNNSSEQKNIGEQIAIRMFGLQCKSIGQIDDFVKIGLIGKTVPVYPKINGIRKGREDMKHYHANFDEWASETVFEDSSIYEYFAQHSFLLIVFERNERNNHDAEIFVGFKRIFFDEDFIQTEVRKTWEEVRNLIVNNQLRIIEEVDKNGNVIVNPTGTIKQSPNFPKKGKIGSSDRHEVFIRGGAPTTEEKYKTQIVNGLRMMPQSVWLSKEYIIQKLGDL